MKISFLTAALCLATAAAQAQIVQTASGQVQGFTANGISNFEGIPYAAPPVGPLRWVAPQPPAAFTGVFQATHFGSQCAQPLSMFGYPGTNEDCLYLNVQTPSTATAVSNLPVMVWIHGGAFITGEGWDYDGSALINDGHVVFVTLNYRLGLFGFLAHPALAAEAPFHISGNYGLLDQQAAIAWVKQNIANFGGNPANVTIFGESAGGQSVIDQLTSPFLAKVHNAIIESGAYNTNLPTLAAAEATGQAIAADPNRGLNCTSQTAACLRALTATQLVNAINPLTDLGAISPNVDGVILPMQPLKSFNAGHFQHVPIINGSNHDEWRLFVVLNDLLGGGPLTATTFVSTIQAQYGATEGAAILAEYPLAAYASPNYDYAALVTDGGFACGAHLVNALLAQYTTVYSYELNDPNAPDLFLPPDPNLPNTGDSHASELPYIFPLLQSALFGKGVAQFSPAQLALASGMRLSWTSLARYGRPLNPHGGAWSRYTTASDTVLSLVPPSPTAEFSFVPDHYCDFWKPYLLQQAGLPAGTPF